MGDTGEMDTLNGATSTHLCCNRRKRFCYAASKKMFNYFFPEKLLYSPSNPRIMNIYKQLFIILLSVFPFTANAIVGILDNIIIEGKVHKLYDYPLEKNTELAKKLREILPEKVTLDGKVWEHTNCSREYVATWEIADNKLFLRKIEFEVWLYGKPCSSAKYQWIDLSKEKLENVFAKYRTEEGIHAAWVNEELVFDGETTTTTLYTEETEAAGFNEDTIIISDITVERICKQEFHASVKNGNVQIDKQVEEFLELDYNTIRQLCKDISKVFPWEELPNTSHLVIALKEIRFSEDGTIKDCVINGHKEKNDLKELLAIKRVLRKCKWPKVALDKDDDLRTVLVLANRFH